jgi:hypothetical protein
MAHRNAADDAFDDALPPALLTRLVLAAHLEVSPAHIALHHHLERDLGVTRLGLVLVARHLEHTEQLCVPFALVAAVDTVADLANLVAAARRTRAPFEAALSP